ncbi:MAG: TetR family transcriptional regulator [Tessaracoccus sp.]|uniref:TetR family transcriptional regulator n=1 Tax=Tessaracoccus sp. TaxID=1971211 RepID=UPI001EC4DF4F|nr:TetR family transcriptional regulator [Tessaracoccus sp.]MBK7821483.1 TetR family transcriptional regulator [Tessaracoccus sp.]
MALSRVAIVEAGLGILDAYGLGDLSMRRVADALGVQAGALYYHVPNKQSLLAALSDEVLAEVAEPTSGRPAQEWLSAWADSVRGALLARRDGAELVASSLALGLGGVDLVTPTTRCLADAGNPRPEATARALLHLILGLCVTDQTRAQLHELGVVAAFDARVAQDDFAWAVATFVSGAVRVD